ncbi:hypothetical protein SADUNF_Sadunf02G0126200 [Salix dunnii]|uniref:Uncharacterized protein n=1 Tax=Salix dunnii TaxID=1413687 RepID=A0A835N7J5_9ROSI|nr:hypothetical protein SADUNF_Sadunf02G0126200 [Salix dunnii]
MVETRSGAVLEASPSEVQGSARIIQQQIDENVKAIASTTMRMEAKFEALLALIEERPPQIGIQSHPVLPRAGMPIGEVMEPRAIRQPMDANLHPIGRNGMD